MEILPVKKEKSLDMIVPGTSLFLGNKINQFMQNIMLIQILAMSGVIMAITWLYCDWSD